MTDSMHNIIQTVFYRGCGTNQLPNNESEYQRQKTKMSGDVEYRPFSGRSEWGDETAEFWVERCINLKGQCVTS